MYRIKVLLTLALVVVLLLINWHAGILILSFACTYLYLGRKFSNDLIDSHAFLFVVTLFTYTATLGIFILICSAIANISLSDVLLIVVASFTLLYLYDTGFTLQRSPTRKILKTSDIVSIFVACTAFGLLAILPLSNLSAQKQHSNFLVLLTGNTDSAAHLAMFNDYLGFGTTQIWRENAPSRGRADGFYPSSWHGANATIAKALDPSLQPGVNSAALFGLLNVFWITILVFMVSRYSFTIYNLVSTKQRWISVYLAIPLLSLTTFYFFFVHLLRFGFFSFTPQLITIILLAYCLHQLLQNGIGSKSGLGLAWLYCVISLASWVLLLPVALGATFLTSLFAYIDKPKHKKLFIAELKSSWPLFVLGALGVIAQLWQMNNAPPASSTGIRNGILLDGGAPIYSTFLYILLFLGLGYAIFYHMQKKYENTEFYKPVLIIGMVTILFAGVLFVYQTYYTGTTHYYYYKSVWLLPTLLSPISIVMFAVYMDKVKDRPLALLVALTFPIFLIQFLPSDTGVLEFMRGSRTVSTSINESVWLEMHNNTYPTNRITIYFVNSGTNESSTIATLLVAANRPFNECFQTLSDKIIYKSTDTALREIVSTEPAGVCNDKHLILKVDPSYSNIVESGKYSKYYSVDYLHV